MPDEGIDRVRLPIRRPRFAGVTKRTLADSMPDWSQASHVQAESRAPGGGSRARGLMPVAVVPARIGRRSANNAGRRKEIREPARLESAGHPPRN